MNISLSALDEKRFGIVTAKATLDANDDANDDANAANFKQKVLNWCEKENVQLLIARVPTEQIDLVQELEQAGFILTDTLVYFRNKHLVETEIGLTELDGEFSWRIAVPGDSEDIAQLATKVFSDYGGHYHADRRLNRSDCDLVYVSWAENSCVKSACSDVMLLVTYESKPVGFLTIKMQEADETGEIMLNGVHPDFQGKGLYRSLILLAKKWAIQQQLKQLVVSTQITNLAVQKVWCRQGFEPHKSVYTFHKWFTAAQPNLILTNDSI